MSEILRSYISISEMAESLQMSRVRFYSLIKAGIFPAPIKKGNMRPYFDHDLQQQCLDVRQNNRSIDGRPVLFYQKSAKASQKSRQKKKEQSEYRWIINTLGDLGVENVDERQVQATIKRLYPAGTAQITEEDVIKTLFTELSSQLV